MQKYCIAKMKNKIVSFLLEANGRAVEIHADAQEQAVSLGNIYIGRVQRVAANLQAAFVEIQPGLVCYLPLERARHPVYTKKGASASIQQGDELAVQVAREAMKSKGPSVTAELCLTGNYVILDMGKPGIGVSRKLPEETRERLRAIAGKFPETDAGIVLRTNAADAAEEVITAEFEKLLGLLNTIREKAVYHPFGSCLWRQPPLWLRRLSSLRRSELEAVVIEDAQLYEQAARWLEEGQEELLGVLRHYEDSLLPMAKLFSLEHRLEQALSERVWLNSGAYLVIQPTEALTVIDVNSGKSDIGTYRRDSEKRRETAICKVNLEAARETARQLRLRNISGIIIVDFINMEEEGNQRLVMEELNRSLLPDPMQARAIDMTRLNLVEITRRKMERPLAEQLRA